MDNFNLSQEEIDALLRQMSQQAQSEASTPELSDADKDTLGEIANISLGSAATSLSHLLGQRVEITTPDVRLKRREEVTVDFPRPYVVVTVEYTSGLHGSNVLLVELADALTIADLMLGGDGRPQGQELGELQLSALAEAMNQMMGGAATAMSNVFHCRIDISTPKVAVIDLAGTDVQHVGPEEWLVQVSFRLRIGTLVDSALIQFIPFSFVREMMAALQADQGLSEVAASAESLSSGTAAAHDRSESARPQTVVELKRPEFVDFTAESPVSAEAVRNLDLLLDVPLQITVELGRTRRQIREILGLAPGAILELDKLAGEPVDILVNNKRIAVGEVVVVDESFGVRVTDILSPAERVRNLQQSSTKPMSGAG